MGEHLDSAIANLIEYRDGLRAQIAQLDSAVRNLQTIQKQIRTAVPPVPTAKPEPRRGGPARLTPGQIAEMRKLYETGVLPTDSQLAERFGVTPEGVRYHRMRQHWKSPHTGTTRELLAARVHCPSCKAFTQTDPCDQCGKAVRLS